MAALKDLGTVLQADVLIVEAASPAWPAPSPPRRPIPTSTSSSSTRSSRAGAARPTRAAATSCSSTRPSSTACSTSTSTTWATSSRTRTFLLDFAKQSRPDLERLESWGVHIYRGDDGEPKYVRWLPEHPWRLAVLDQDLTLNMAKHARKLGVRFKDRVEIVDLLKDGDRVCGAIGFGIIDGECVVAQAGAVVLANGNQCYKLMPRWSSAGGEGIAAAYRAGAAMRGAEFGNFINWVFADTKEVCQGAEDVLYNAKGENISRSACGPRSNRMSASKEVVEWWREMKAGNGPICANMAENYVNNEIVPAFHEDKLAVRPVSMKFWGLSSARPWRPPRCAAPCSPSCPD